MLWVFVQKVDRAKQLYFDKFDVGFHDFIGVTFDFVINSRDFRILKLGL
jgi:hypothetical protein